MSAFKPASHPGILHHYTPRYVAFEHTPTPTSSTATPTPRNYVLFIGGLGDSLLTVHYAAALARALPPTWSLVEVTLPSTATGWTTSTLHRDVPPLSTSIQYFRALGTANRATGPPPRIVLLGHSTGAQLAMHYVAGPWASPWTDIKAEHGSGERAPVDAIVLQSGISDADGIRGVMAREKYEESVAVAEEWVRDGRGGDVLPGRVHGLFYGPRMLPSAERWASLVSADGRGEDDYFSAGLGVDRLERTWGRLGEMGVKCLVLLSGEDEHLVVSGVERGAVGLVGRWVDAVRQGGGWADGAVVEGASHNLNGNGDGVVQDLVGRIVRFLGVVESGEEGLGRERL